MLRNKCLSEKVLLLGIDGMDPRFTKRMIAEGKMPNTQKLIEKGAAREDLMLLGAIPTITPPMWATLGTGCYPMTHGIMDYYVNPPGEPDISISGVFSHLLKAEPLWNVTAKAGKKTLVWHWPGGSFPPMIDDPNLMMVDGTSPGSVGGWYAARDADSLFIASTKAEKVSFKPFSVAISDQVDVNEKLKVVPFSYRDVQSPETLERVAKHFEDLKQHVEVNGYQANPDDVWTTMEWEREDGYGGFMWDLADMPSNCTISPIKDAEGWAFDIPADAKEFVMIMAFRAVTRYGLIVKNESGLYDKVILYKDKETSEPLGVLERDVFTACIYDDFPNGDIVERVIRNMRALDIAEDGSFVRIWCSKAMTTENDTVWFPKSLFWEITDKFGPMMPTSLMGGNDADLILKCNNEQWKLAAKWQADSLNYMIHEHGVEVIFSHYHGPDLQSHNYMKYLKNRVTSRYDESEVVKFAEATYITTDEYIGEFLPLLDEGWTILVFSDHAQTCPEETVHLMGSMNGINADPMRALGYTVMQRDENGNEIAAIDWDKTTAVQVRSNSIYINLKGRDIHGIVDPADKYELEERIITDLYNIKDVKTGHRVVAFALHNKDAVLLGLGGPMGADIVFCVHDDYCGDHGPSMSTACGHNDTSVSPIFIAAGAGIKEGYCINRYIREVDVTPTAAVLLGVELPAECEGAPAYQIFTESL